MGDQDTHVETEAAVVAGRGWFNEDWAATILGLVILVLVLVGIIPRGLIP